MFDVNEKEKRVLSNWILQNLADYSFGSVYDPFSGSGKFAYSLKKLGYQVITSDLLQANYWWKKGIIENGTTVISPDTVRTVLDDSVKVSVSFSEWTDSFFTAEESRSLEVWRANINNLSVSDEEKALLYVAVYLTIDYWITYNRRYFQNKTMKPIEVFTYYINLVNRMVFDNGFPNTTYYYDSYDIAQDIGTELVYFYPPSKQGFRNYNIRFYLWECWTRGVSQINLEGVIARAEYPKLGQVFNTNEEYYEALDAFLQKIQGNGIWAISFNDRFGPDKENLISCVGKYREITKIAEIDLPYPTAAGSTNIKEGIMIAVA